MKVIDQYIELWNERDAVRRRELLADIWAEDGEYVDPLGTAGGLPAIDAMIAGAQGQFPGFVFTLAGPVDTHHSIARFTWELMAGDGEPLVIGSDTAVLNEDGRLQQVYGFLDKVPPA
jgi:hypothetical protein